MPLFSLGHGTIFRISAFCGRLAEEESDIELGRFRTLSVCSRIASFALGGRIPAGYGADRSDALSVRYILTARSQKDGRGRVRIGFPLSETETGSVVWSAKLMRPFDDLLNVVRRNDRQGAVATVSRANG